MLKGAFPEAEITVTDLANDEEHYKIQVISPTFHGKTKIQQHQMVHQALKDVIGGILHAASIITQLPK